MPMHMKEFFSIDELQQAELVKSMPFSRATPVMKIPATLKSPFYNHQGPGTLKDTVSAVFDLQTDPLQKTPLADPVIQARMHQLAIDQMKVQHAPAEYFERLALAA
jgi:hypothetical protein